MLEIQSWVTEKVTGQGQSRPNWVTRFCHCFAQFKQINQVCLLEALKIHIGLD